MELHPNKLALIRIGALMTAVVALSAVNVSLGTLDAAGLLIFASGAAVYLTLVKLGSIDRQGQVDYLQSGEAGVATATVCGLAAFVSHNAFAALGASAVALMSYNVFRRTLLDSGHRAQAFAGIVATAVSLIALAVLFSGAGLDSRQLVASLPALGAPRSLAGKLYLLPAFMTLAAAALYLFSRSMDEIAAFAQGPRYFELTGSRFWLIDLALVLLKSVLTAIVFLCLGWAGGLGVYLQRSANFNSMTDDIAFGLALLLYAHLIALIAPFGGPVGVVIVSAVVSYAAHSIATKRGTMP